MADSDSQLLNDVKLKLREKYEPIFERIQTREEDRGELTEDQIQSMVEDLAKRNPKAGEMMKKGLAQFGHVSQYRFQPDESRLAAQIEQEAEELLTFVQTVRQESGLTGPLTEDEYYGASFRKNQASIEASKAALRNRIEANPNDPRTRVFQSLMNLVDQDQPDLASMNRRDLTEDQLEEATSRINDRWMEFINEIIDQRNMDGEES